MQNSSNETINCNRLPEVIGLLCQSKGFLPEDHAKPFICAKVLYCLGLKSKNNTLKKFVSKLNPDSRNYNSGLAYNLAMGYTPLGSATARHFYVSGAKESLRSYLIAMKPDELELLGTFLQKYWFSESQQDEIDKYIELLMRAFLQLSHKGEAIPFTRSELQSLRDTAKNRELVSKFGDELFAECGENHICPLCRKNVLSKARVDNDGFMVAVIDSSESVDDPHNLIALCPDCFTKHLGCGTDADFTALRTAKDRILRLLKGTVLLSRMPVDAQVKQILISLGNEDELPIEDITIEWNAVMVKTKLASKKRLIQEIEGLVVDNRQMVLQCLQFLDKSKTVHGMSIAKRIKAKFEKLDKEFSKRILELERDIRIGVIWRDLVTHLMDISDCEEEAAKIVVAYYIQDCEVFRAGS